MFDLDPASLVAALRLVLAALGLQLLLLLLAAVWIQVRWERRYQRQERCHALWEAALLRHLYGGDDNLQAFGPLGVQERRLLVPFLLRVLNTLGGAEGRAVRGLYHRLELFRGLGERLHARRAKARALAILEVSTFGVHGHFPKVLELLSDPVPHVAHAAARGLASTGRLDYAAAVVNWAVAQDRFQQGRVLEILERFGADFTPWLEARLAHRERFNLREWLIYAQLAASGKQVAEPSHLIAMLGMEDVDALAAAIRALGVLGLPETRPFLVPFVRDASWILRAQAAKALGALGGVECLPELLALTGDSVFTVRRNAAHALCEVGEAGIAVLRKLAADDAALPCARDLARERLHWLDAPEVA